MLAKKTLGVFCGANVGSRKIYTDAAKELAAALVHKKITLIFGGGKVGLMGVIADEVLALGGEAIGVIPEMLVKREVAHETLTQLHIVPSMHERKLLILNLSQAFIMMPGGVGSLDEFFEMVTLMQLQFHDKPCAILNVNGYYDSMLKFLDHAVAESFFPATIRDKLVVETDCKILIDKICLDESLMLQESA